MEIAKGKKVTIIYELFINNKRGQFIEKRTKENPLTITFGDTNILPAFEKKLLGKKKGHYFDFKLTPEEAYGQKHLEGLRDAPRIFFEKDGQLDANIVLGAFITMKSKDGQQRPARVIEIKDDVIKLDFNHPLAGQTLYYQGGILEVE